MFLTSEIWTWQLKRYRKPLLPTLQNCQATTFNFHYLSLINLYGFKALGSHQRMCFPYHPRKTIYIHEFVDICSVISNSFMSSFSMWLLGEMSQFEAGRLGSGGSHGLNLPVGGFSHLEIEIVKRESFGRLCGKNGCKTQHQPTEPGLRFWRKRFFHSPQLLKPTQKWAWRLGFSFLTHSRMPNHLLQHLLPGCLSVSQYQYEFNR